MKKERVCKCAEGYHSHPNYGCHPIDKPHKPGTVASDEHKKRGITNTWYEQHGTTEEQFDEHPEDFDVSGRKQNQLKTVELPENFDELPEEEQERIWEEYQQAMIDNQNAMAELQGDFDSSELNDKATDEEMYAYLKDIHYEEIDPSWKRHVAQAYREAMASGQDMLDYDYDRYKSRRKSIMKMTFNDMIKAQRRKNYRRKR